MAKTISVEDIVKLHDAGSLSIEDARKSGIKAIRRLVKDWTVEDGFEGAKALVEAGIFPKRGEDAATNQPFIKVCLSLVEDLVNPSYENYENFSKFIDAGLLTASDMKDSIVKYLEEADETELFEEFVSLELINASELTYMVHEHLNRNDVDDIEQFRAWIDCGIFTSSDAHGWVRDLVISEDVDLSYLDIILEEDLVDTSEPDLQDFIRQKIKEAFAEAYNVSEDALDAFIG
jgi:hypothetical protein